MRPTKTLGVAVWSLLLVAACGGGGGDTPAQTGPTAEGAYGGSLTGSSSNTFSLLVLENGEFWSAYGTQSAPTATFFVRGIVQGTGTSNNGSFTSSNAKDFGFAPAVAGTINSTYNASTPSFSGTFSGSFGAVTFSGGPIQGSTYNYNAAASISEIAGAWALTNLAGAAVALNVSSNGAFTASSAGCNFSGTITPRPSGKNVFNVALTFGAAPCLLAGQTGSGIGVVYPLTSGARQLILAAVDGTRTYGSMAFGAR